MIPADLLLLINLAATWFMVGLIWFVQLVHYPQFAMVGVEGFAAYHSRHKRFTTIVVATPMLIEAFTAVALVLRPPVGASAPFLWTGVALVGVIWLSTIFLQVPCHNRLGSTGADDACCRRLSRSNWIRTIAWTARGIVMAGVMAQVA